MLTSGPYVGILIICEALSVRSEDVQPKMPKLLLSHIHDENGGMRGKETQEASSLLSNLLKFIFNGILV